VLGAKQAVVIAASLTDPQPAATEVLRISGGMIVEPVGKSDWVTIGRGQALAGANPTVAIGSNIIAQSGQVVVGDSANGGTNAGTVCIGRNSNANGGSGISINGNVVVGGAAACVALQGQVNNGTGSTVAIGGILAGGSADNGVLVGIGSTGAGFDQVVIGHNASASAAAAGGVAIGGANGGLAARSNGAGAIAVGFGAQADNTGCIVLGSSISGGSTKATHDQCIVIGSGVNTSSPNMAFIGGPQTIINTMVVGSGFSRAGATPVTLQLTARTGAGNLAGSDFTLQSGPGVGNDLTAGFISFKTPLTAGAGVTQGMNTRMQVQPGGGVLVSAPDAAGFTLALTAFGGAAQPAVSITNLTNGAAAAVGTLNNAPVAGNPTFWVPFSINGVVRYCPFW
jgi:hypothetical protein